MLWLPSPPPEHSHLDPESPKYKAIQSLHENALWPGKDTLGMPSSKRMRMHNPETGENVMVDRLPHEIKTPGLLCHIGGRCAWVDAMLEHMFINEKGETEWRNKGNERQYKAWRAKFDKKAKSIIDVASEFYDIDAFESEPIPRLDI